MRIRFRRHGRRDDSMAERHRGISVLRCLLMTAGALAILYLLIVYVLMPFLAMLTVS